MKLPDPVVAAAKADEKWTKEVEHVMSLVDSALNGSYACLKEAHARKDLPSQLQANSQIIELAALKSRVLSNFYSPPRREENGSEGA